MLDLTLNNDGDLDVSAAGDISLTTSIRQAILVRLKWIYEEWRLGPEFGFQWFESVYVKNPDTSLIGQLIHDQIMSVDGVNSATVNVRSFDCSSRKIVFQFTCTTDEETFKEEVTLNA